MGDDGTEARSHLVFPMGHGVVAVTVTNPTGRFLTDVEVEVVFAGDHIGGFEEAPELVKLPPEPRPYGVRTPSRFLDPGLGLMRRY
jgi:hypothetical protein